MQARYIKIDHDKLLMSPKNDFVFKSIFGDEKNKDILSAFLSAVTGIKMEDLQDLQLLNPELPREFLEDKLGILDVRVRLKDGTSIDIEIQLSYAKYMAKRSLYYWSKMYTSSIKKGDVYSTLKKAVTINILDFIILPLDQIYSKFYIKEDKSNYRLTDALEIYYLELEKLRHNKYKRLVDREDPIIKWMMFLNAENKEELDMLSKEVSEIEKAVSTLEKLSQNEEQRLIYEAREKYLFDIASLKAEGLEEGIEVGKKEGREVGRKEGKKVGRKEGIKESREEIAKELIKGGMELSLVAKYTKLSMDKILLIKKEL